MKKNYFRFFSCLFLGVSVAGLYIRYNVPWLVALITVLIPGGLAYADGMFEGVKLAKKQKGKEEKEFACDLKLSPHCGLPCPDMEEKTSRCFLKMKAKVKFL